MNEIVNTKLYSSIRDVLESARDNVRRTVNFAMVQAYWTIGKLIIEDEQKGERRAEYGKAVLDELSKRLTDEFGKGFDVSNLRKMRLFYSLFPIQDTLRPELSWSHYRFMLKVENKDARLWYMNEAANEGWSTRQLDRQISVLYYDRLLASGNNEEVINEAQGKIAEIKRERNRIENSEINS